MKQITLILTMIFCAIFSSAQELKVKSFIHDEMNLEARLDGGRTDLNGKQCALVKVMVRDNIMKCKGGNVGAIIADGIVKKIFVSPSARFLELEFQYNFPLKVTFADYGYAKLTEGCTYTITLVDAYLLSQQPVQPQNQPQGSTTIAQNSTSQETPSLHSTASAGLIPITVNGVSFNMIKVEGGSFFMGATKEQRNSDDDEKPAHHVTLSTYYIGETEVTQTLWTAIMGNNPSNFKGDNLPVETISWNDCQKFIDKLNNLTGRYFRLPTEAEWEYAARGGNKSRHTQYSGSSNIDEVAWYWQNCGDKYLLGDWDWNKIEKNNCKPHPVKTKKANELGIYDMSGNVWEWCQDWYGSYESNAQTNPTGPDSGTKRVSRGGCWINYARGCRSAFRSSNSPDGRDDYLGLRLALSE